jgi:hypothetical protein
MHEENHDMEAIKADYRTYLAECGEEPVSEATRGEEICANCNEPIEDHDAPQECPCGCLRRVCRRCYRMVKKNLATKAGTRE